MTDEPKQPKRDLYTSAPEQHRDQFENKYTNNEGKPRRRHWKRILITLLVIVVLAVIGYAAVIGHNLAAVSTQPFRLAGLTSDSSGRTNILVLGQGDPGHAGEGLTDTIMLLSLNRRTHQVAEISIPRDLRVPIAGYGSGKINSANADGGVALAEQTVSNTFGIPINAYISTDFSGLTGIVDAVGGLDIDVKSALIDTEYPCDNDQYKVCGLDIQPGLQHMNGATVLEYTRCRKGTCGNDFGRAERQQEVLGLLRQKVVRWQTLANPVQLSKLTRAIQSALTTDMGAVQLLQFAYDWQHSGSQPIQLVLSTSPGGYLTSAAGSSDLLPASGNFAAISDRIQNIFTEPTATTDLPNQ